MTVDLDDQLRQAFRCPSTDRAIGVPVQKDSKTGQHVVFWRDIQNEFENADHVQTHESRAVPFLTDENSDLITPWRISYHPGVELEVIVKTHDQDSFTGAIVSLDEVSSGEVKRNDGSTDPVSSVQTTTDAKAVVNTDNQTDDSHQRHQTQYNEMQQFMKRSNEMLLRAQSTNEDLREQIHQLNQQQHNTNRDLVMNQERLIRIQREAMDSLGTIRNRIEAVFTQTYELPEYSVSRLFIVLPKSEEALREMTTSLTAEDFRLYFLCECGSHTMLEGSKTQHEVHLAKHDGYELDRPAEFFERYGPYLVTMLQMIQFGVATAGMIVQPISHRKVIEDFSTVLKYPKQDVSPLIINTIKYLQRLQGIHSTMSSRESLLVQQGTAIENQGILQGEDLSQLSSYLRVKDEGHTLGSMYRMVTSEGQVKWVCRDHYRNKYRESTSQQLQGVVKENGGCWNEETGKIKINLKSDMNAGHFYRALVSARGIQELDITLEWDATMHDIQALASTVTVANVICLIVDGSHFKHSPLDLINRKRRFDSIMQLVANEKIQYLKLRGFEAFFHRVSQSPLEPSSRMRAFSMDSGDVLSRKHMNSFKDFLKHSPPLTTLKLRIGEEYSLMRTTTDILTKLPRLETLTTSYGGISVASRVLDGQIQDVDLTIARVGDLSSNELQFIQQDHLTRLAIKYTPQEADDNQLVDVLRRWPRLSYLQIGCDASRALAVINHITSAREKIVRSQKPSRLRTFELMDEKLVSFDEYDECDDSIHLQSRLLFTEDSTFYDMRTWIRLGNGMSIADKHPVYDLVRQYGWSIVFMEENATCNDTFAAILDDIPIPEGRLCQLEALCLEVAKFTAPGFERLDSIIQRSPNFKQLGLHIENVQVSQSNTVLSLIRRYGSKLFKLQLHGTSSTEWLQKFALSFPSRESFPILGSFELSFESVYNVPWTCVRWIAAMISTSNQVPASSSSSQVSAVTRHGIRKIVLSHVQLQPEGWKAIIDGLDFAALRHLDLRSSNLYGDLFSSLVKRLPEDMTSKIPLEVFNLEHTDIHAGVNAHDLELLLAELRLKVPAAKITTTVPKTRSILAPWRK
ncbi:hypothetical protein B0O80DRAFT_209765 [Mortierella sp. GBAus27b]|nr:hypothetical protein BGX31_010106 [Mortierella sp. GBA43]KAI8347740.1 hypothetical protein B0O80DRAFT_209765 [Mortierella sp. GBAus27b]